MRHGARGMGRFMRHEARGMGHERKTATSSARSCLMPHASCLLALTMVFASVANAQAVPLGRIAEDARVIDRVAELSKRDMPRDLLKRMLEQDIDLLRGKRNDGTYQYASWERLEADRISDSFS